MVWVSKFLKQKNNSPPKRAGAHKNYSNERKVKFLFACVNVSRASLCPSDFSVSVRVLVDNRLFSKQKIVFLTGECEDLYTEPHKEKSAAPDFL
jgi:hypothetical protein